MQATNRNQTNFYAEEPTINIQRSMFTRAFNHKTTFNAGQIIPFYVDLDIMPGMTIKNKTKLLVRMSTPIYPVMDNAYIDTYYFKIPHWTVWENWKAFNGENEMGAWANTTEYEVPMFTTSGTSGTTADTMVQPGDLADYFGIPTKVAGIQFQQLAHRAYFRTYNFWFRDQNLIAPIQYNEGDDNVAYQNMVGGVKPLMAAKFHDYFTSALPQPQKGDAVMTPLGTSAPVTVTSTGNPLYLQNTNQNYYGFLKTGNTTGGSTNYMTIQAGQNASVQPIDIQLEYRSGLTAVADLTAATAATINALRLAFATQRVMEKMARYGSRYNEIIRGIWGVNSPNASLHVPEYLGGERIPVNMETVLQNSGTTSESPLGETGAFSVTFESNIDFTKSFEEHCIILGLCVIRTDHTYQQGLARQWTRTRLYDYYQPSFAHLGNQPIYNYEIYAQGNATDQEVFGYKEAWSEYKQLQNRVSGEMRSNYPQSLDSWHYADDYANLPVLSQNWIQETDVNVARTLATTNTSAQFIADFYIEQEVAAPIPVHCTPGLIDHF